MDLLFSKENIMLRAGGPAGMICCDQMMVFDFGVSVSSRNWLPKQLNKVCVGDRWISASQCILIFTSTLFCCEPHMTHAFLLPPTPGQLYDILAIWQLGQWRTLSQGFLLCEESGNYSSKWYNFWLL
jgi:hypothetical protein